MFDSWHYRHHVGNLYFLLSLDSPSQRAVFLYRPLKLSITVASAAPSPIHPRTHIPCFSHCFYPSLLLLLLLLVNYILQGTRIRREQMAEMDAAYTLSLSVVWAGLHLKGCLISGRLLRVPVRKKIFTLLEAISTGTHSHVIKLVTPLS